MTMMLPIRLIGTMSNLSPGCGYPTHLEVIYLNEDDCELVSGSSTYGADTTPWLGLVAGGASVAQPRFPM